MLIWDELKQQSITEYSYICTYVVCQVAVVPHLILWTGSSPPSLPLTRELKWCMVVALASSLRGATQQCVAAMECGEQIQLSINAQVSACVRMVSVYGCKVIVFVL